MKPRREHDGIGRPGTLFRKALALIGLSALACTTAEGEVGVYLAPQQGRRDAGVLHIPRPDSGASRRDAMAPSSQCRPGRYDGTFSCNFGFMQSCQQNPGTGGFVLTGPLSLTLVESSAGEFLSVSGGTLDAASGGFMLTGPLSGLLDCRADTFTGSFDGTYSGTPLPPLPAVNGELSGPISSHYDSRQPALTNGEWCLTATKPGTKWTDPCADLPSTDPLSCLAGSCKGTWTAVYVPGT